MSVKAIGVSISGEVIGVVGRLKSLKSNSLAREKGLLGSLSPTEDAGVSFSVKAIIVSSSVKAIGVSVSLKAIMKNQTAKIFIFDRSSSKKISSNAPVDKHKVPAVSMILTSLSQCGMWDDL